MRDSRISFAAGRRVCLGVFVAFALFTGLTPSAVQAQSTVESIDSVRKSVVKIFGAGGIRRLEAYGTGFLVSPDGHIATVWSHVLDADTVTVILDDGRKFEGKVLGAEPQLDLAVLKIEAEELPYIDLENSTATAGSGTRVLGFSNMFKVATGDEPVSVLHGVIAAKTRLTARRGTYEIPYNGPVYVVDAITNNPGAAGGLLTTRDGRPLAMIGKELRNSQSNTWLNYAIPVTELKTAIGEIISGNFVAKAPDPNAGSDPRNYGPLDFGLVMVPDVLFRTPAFVDSVVANSDSANSGLRSDDLILFVNDELVQSVKTLNTLLGTLEEGDTLRLVIRRGGTLISVEFPVPEKNRKK